MRKFDAGVARAEMRIIADMLKRAERASDYESGHYDDNRARYDELKRQLEKHNKRVIDYLNM